MFLSPWFAIAGLVLAAGPIAIHLLNRRRYRVVPWAAMEFLRHAIRRSRRLIRLQDLLLLLLRTVCVLLFGLAMARPFLTRGSAALGANEPVHAVLVVDNSLSMAYERLDGTVLERAKGRAGEFIERLPPGSRISILPLCGSAQDFSLGAYSTKEDALEALAAIEPVDRAATAEAAIDLAKEACRRVPNPPAKQVVFLSDQQEGNWPAESLAAQLESLPATLQVVETAEKDAENAWIADFRLQEGIADVGSPAVFLATVRFDGALPRQDVQVTLSVDGAVLATQTIELQPGQAREVRFPPYQFDVPVPPGRVAFVPAEVSIPPDRLPADDRRCLAVPVVAALPVVFVDQLGPDEDVQRDRLGETFRLRRLLAPVTQRGPRDPQLVQVRHLKLDRLDVEVLKDARLVVVAGLPQPRPEAVKLLREYVEQGGSLVLAAGGDFDPAAWSEAAWLDGAGILPAPLKPASLGGIPGPAAPAIKPFQLDLSSLVHDYFLLEDTPREELEDLYRLPYFFKAVEADVSEATVEEIVRRETARLEKDRAALADADRRLAELADREAKGTAGEGERQERAQLEKARGETRPRWLLWSQAEEGSESSAPAAAELAERTRPRVRGTFTNQVPFLVERDVGRGRVLFVSSGVFRQWNTLTSTNAVLIFDRIFRDLLERTLPKRNLTTTERLAVPVPVELRSAKLTLTDPAGGETPISADALAGDRCGVVVRNLPQRGFYRITAEQADARQAGVPAGRGAAASLPGGKLIDVLLAVNGPARESELATLGESELRGRMEGAEYRWIAGEESIRLTAARLIGEEMWKWLLAAVLGCLVLEMIVLGWPLAGRERSP